MLLGVPTSNHEVIRSGSWHTTNNPEYLNIFQSLKNKFDFHLINFNFEQQR